MRNAALFTALLFTVCAAFSPRSHAQSPAAYAIMDAASGHFLDAANSDRKLQVGSLTKIATAMVVIDWAEVTKQDLNTLVTVPDVPAALAVGNPIGWQSGDRISLRDLLYAALMQSDNIAAFTLAGHVGAALNGKSTPDERFVAQMNALARQLRMERTLFVNPHGLDSAERKLPFSTAADIARLTRYAMSKPAFRFLVSQKERRILIERAAGTQFAYSLRNTNELLGVNGVDGVKTGTTRRAGECLVISSERPPESIRNGESFIITPRRLIVVVIGAPDRFRVASGLLDRGWELHQGWVTAGRPVTKGRL